MGAGWNIRRIMAGNVTAMILSCGCWARRWRRVFLVLGVCRGLQLINVHLKGTLIQDLGVEGDQTHMAGGGADKQHKVVVEEGTLLREVVGGKGGVANSAHHQAVGRLGTGLRVNCRAEDGTIEGLEWADPAGKPFMLAVQWHPERMFASRMVG